MKYKCASCGQEHDEWPALAYSSPSGYNDLTEDEKKEIATLSSDFCVITYPDQTDRFIRCTFTLKVVDHCEDLEYGIWSTLSEKSYQNYTDNYNNPEHTEQYFGWFSNRLFGYENSLSVPTTVRTKTGNQRPEVIPHEDFDHPLVKDYYNGITKAEAERRIQNMLDLIK